MSQVLGSIVINDMLDNLYERAHAIQCWDNFVSNKITHHKSPDNMNNTNDGYFEKLMRDVELLYPNCKKFSKLEYLIKLLYDKTMFGWSQKSFKYILNLIKEALPDG